VYELMHKSFSDCHTFWTFEFLFFVLFLRGVISDLGWFRPKSGIKTALTRGHESWSHFAFAYGTTAVIMLQIINTTKAAEGYKTIVTIVDMAMLLYLCFYNSWCRNQIVGIVTKSKNKIEC
jgi:hypothetical protein